MGKQRKQYTFQSTLPSEERSDAQRVVPLVGLSGFNPRSPPKRGATVVVSRPLPLSKFQSTLPSEERSDMAR